jgi:hypothetical protein
MVILLLLLMLPPFVWPGGIKDQVVGSSKMSKMSSMSGTCGSVLGMVIVSDLHAETQQVDGMGYRRRGTGKLRRVGE